MTNVLLLEDYPVHRELEADALVTAGFAVTAVGSLVEAKAILGAIRADPSAWVVVADLRLAGEDFAGLRLVEEMEEDPSLSDVPVLIASATNPDKIAAALGKRKPRKWACLSKPFLKRELVAEVRRLLEKDPG